MTQLTDKAKYAIICLHEKNMSIHDIASTLDVNKNTVSLWIDRYQQTNSIDRKKGSGRPTNTSNDEIITVFKELNANPYLTLDKLYSLLNQKSVVSHYKIRKILLDNNYVFGIPPTIFPLSEDVKKKRLDFAITHLSIDWTKIVFLDETSCWLNNKRVARWHNTNNINDNDVLFKHSTKRNIWGAISYDKKIIHIFTENMNADKYVSILNENLNHVYKSEYHLLCDNDSKHTSKKAKTYIKDNNIKIINFPPYSPDLNAIENIWALLKRNIGITKVNSIDEFEKVIMDSWNKIDQILIRNTIDSMKARLEKVIASRGSYIE